MPKYIFIAVILEHFALTFRCRRTLYVTILYVNVVNVLRIVRGITKRHLNIRVLDESSTRK